MKDKESIVKFSRLLYNDGYYFVYELNFYYNNHIRPILFFRTSGWDKPNVCNSIDNLPSMVILSNHCILQEQLVLDFLLKGSPITHFDIDLPNVEDTRYMFEGCKNLIYFKSKMPNSKDTNEMFYKCSDNFFQKHPHLREL